MKYNEKTLAQKILASREAYRSQIISNAVLRVARQKAEETHQAAILAQKIYNQQHGTHHEIASSYQRD